MSSVGLGKQIEPPPRWITHPKNKRIVRNPKEIKDIYIQSGASLLQKKKALSMETEENSRNPSLLILVIESSAQMSKRSST